jgi:SAM-dependent methyltransferase
MAAKAQAAFTECGRDRSRAAMFAFTCSLWYSGPGELVHNDPCRFCVIRTTNIDYQRAASAYAAHRRIHGGVFSMLCDRVGPGPGTRVLEVGCGTGNYIRALAGHQRWEAYGLDPSSAMLACTRSEPGPVSLAVGRAEQIAFAADKFDLIFSVDVIHHVADKGAYYAGVARALRPGGQVCTVTDSADIIRRREILSGYFPETVDRELARYPRISRLEAWMADAGLMGQELVHVKEPYEITSAQSFRDKAYSSLHLISDAAWRVGVERLKRDLAKGPVRGVSRYACVWGCKR